jgi:Raf kinase inhibitor-like YbhB/YbcL family protein
MNIRTKSFWLCPFLLILAGCSKHEGSSATDTAPATIKLTSPAFKEGETIPVQYTGDGMDNSPAMKWSNLPNGTASLVLLCEDPDASSDTWVHWVIYNLPADSKGLDEALPKDATLKNGTLQGKNDFKKTGYNGPAPPKGPAHRYYFKLYALDIKLDLAADASRDQVVKAMAGHILARGELMGKYQG